MTIIPYHRIAARVYNKPLLLVPSALFAVSDYLLSRMDGKVNQFVGERATDNAGNRLPYRVADGTAIISILGELVNRSAGWADADCGLVSYEFLQHQLATAAADPNVLDIMLDVDSPGGESNGCFSIATFIRDVARLKPIGSYANSLALSGGYSIVSATTRIFAPPDSEVGSIGVWMLHYDLSKHLEQHGVKPTLIWRGAHKVDGHPFGPLPADVEARFGEDLDRIYEMFVATVAAGRRNLSPAAIRATEAQCYFAEDALKLGLIDQIGSFDEALASLRKLRPGQSKAPALLGAGGMKRVSPPKISAKTEGKMENCTNDNCGHPHDQHPDDGACTAEGCTCQGYVAPASEPAPAAQPAGGSQSRGESLEQRVARLERENESLRSDNQVQSHQRIAAEVKGFVAPLLAKSDLRFNTQELGVMGELLLAGKCAAAGLSSFTISRAGKDEVHALDAKALGAFIVQGVESLTKVSAKFEPPAGELPAPKTDATISGVTLKDFEVAATDNKASGHIMAAVQARRRELKNQKYSKDDLFRELTAAK